MMNCNDFAELLSHGVEGETVHTHTHVYFNNVHNTVAMPLFSCILLTITCQFFCDLFLEKRQISRSYHMRKGGKKGRGVCIHFDFKAHQHVFLCP